jgi:hypothetical protein
MHCVRALALYAALKGNEFIGSAAEEFVSVKDALPPPTAGAPGVDIRKTTHADALGCRLFGIWDVKWKSQFIGIKPTPKND